MTNTYGPSPTFKVSLLPPPEHGDLLLPVTASRYADSLTLEPKTPPIPAGETSGSAPIILLPGDTSLSIEEGGVFQLDVTYDPGEKAEHIYVHLGDQLLMFPAPGGGGGRPGCSRGRTSHHDRCRVGRNRLRVGEYHQRIPDRPRIAAAVARVRRRRQLRRRQQQLGASGGGGAPAGAGGGGGGGAAQREGTARRPRRARRAAEQR